MGLPTRAPAPRREPRQGLLSPPLWTGPQRAQGPTPVTAASAPSEGPPSAQGRAGSPPLTPGHTQAYKLPRKGRARAAPDPGQSHLADSACAPPAPPGAPPEQRRAIGRCLQGPQGLRSWGGHRPGLRATGPSLPVDRTGGRSQGTARRTGSAAPRTPASGTGRAGRQPEPQLEPALSESKQPPSRPGPAALPPPALPSRDPSGLTRGSPPTQIPGDLAAAATATALYLAWETQAPIVPPGQVSKPPSPRQTGATARRWAGGGGAGSQQPRGCPSAPPGPPPGSHGEGQARSAEAGAGAPPAGADRAVGVLGVLPRGRTARPPSSSPSAGGTRQERGPGGAQGTATQRTPHI